MVIGVAVSKPTVGGGECLQTLIFVQSRYCVLDIPKHGLVVLGQNLYCCVGPIPVISVQVE